MNSYTDFLNVCNCFNNFYKIVCVKMQLQILLGDCRTKDERLVILELLARVKKIEDKVKKQVVKILKKNK